jgi:hypothetical protein
MTTQSTARPKRRPATAAAIRSPAPTPVAATTKPGPKASQNDFFDSSGLLTWGIKLQYDDLTALGRFVGGPDDRDCAATAFAIDERRPTSTNRGHEVLDLEAVALV